jgi:hypothetical protein
MPYTGPTLRGVNYGPTWPGWKPGRKDPQEQTTDSDFCNDAFQSLWSDKYKESPPDDDSAPVDNLLNYRNDLGPIGSHRFNVVRPYDFNMARGSSREAGPALDHINFLNRAQALGLKVVVPISDYFLNDDDYSWNKKSPDSSYSFSSASPDIQRDLTLFISSITDPATGKVHAAVHSISVGNEGDIGENMTVERKDGTRVTTTASDFLARTIWWIYNLHLKLPGIPLSATVSNADQGGTGSYWFKCFIDGVTQGQATALGCALGKTFTAAVPGLSKVDPGYAKYYYNSVNIDQSDSKHPPFGNKLADTLKRYDHWPSEGWPGATFGVPLMFMEVFTANRDIFPDRPPPPQNQHQAQATRARHQAQAAVNQVIAMENYLKSNGAGGPRSTTKFMGYNYFEFNDEPAKGKQTGLFLYSNPHGPTASTGRTALWYKPDGLDNMTFPVCSLTAAAGPSGPGGPSLIAAIGARFPRS